MFDDAGIVRACVFLQIDDKIVRLQGAYRPGEYNDYNTSTIQFILDTPVGALHVEREGKRCKSRRLRAYKI